MPRTDDVFRFRIVLPLKVAANGDATAKRSLTERSALVGTEVDECVVLAVDVENRDLDAFDLVSIRAPGSESAASSASL